MMHHTCYLSFLLAGALLVACDDKAQVTEGTPAAAAKDAQLHSSSADVREVEAQGFGKDHSAAMSDACTQAVSQVCGAAVIKAIISAKGESADLGATVYDGILLSYSVLEDVKERDGSFRIRIKAKVKPPVGDMFRGKIGMVLPALQDVRRAFNCNDLSAATSALVADTVERSLNDVILNDNRFVLLDRSSVLAESERHMAGSSATADTEKGKKGNMRAADYVIDIKLDRATENTTTRNFEVAGRTRHTMVLDVEFMVQIVDVITGGIAARERIRIQRSATAWTREECSAVIQKDLESECSSSVQSKMDSIFNRLSSK